MTRRRNIRDAQVNRRYGALCVREQRLLQVVMNFAQLAELDARGEDAQTQRATPRSSDCSYRVQHLARSDSSRSICATVVTALLQHNRDWSVA